MFSRLSVSGVRIVPYPARAVYVIKGIITNKIAGELLGGVALEFSVIHFQSYLSPTKQTL